MKKAIIFLFLVLIPLVFAAKTETTKELNINDTATVYGKTLTVLSASSMGQLRVSVDGVEGIVRPGINRTTDINEMYIEILNFTYVDSENIESILKITVNFECGDKSCNISETSVSCCTDCGCEENLKCINNLCQKEECVIDWDCDDNNNCTIDKCSTVPPRSCSNTPITQCISNDTCCPSACGPENDADCIKPVEEVTVIEERPVEEVAEETEKAEQPEDKVIISERRKGTIIAVVVALLVVVVGFFILTRK
ncbi:MAG: hypothetical protein Q8N77_02055 [Nanoarchaeota archaeon]|nr:hypothetical protein [Nanoarchaeota archaeon]